VKAFLLESKLYVLREENHYIIEMSSHSSYVCDPAILQPSYVFVLSWWKMDNTGLVPFTTMMS